MGVRNTGRHTLIRVQESIHQTKSLIASLYKSFVVPIVGLMDSVTNRIHDFKSSASIIVKSFNSEYKKTSLRIKVSCMQQAGVTIHVMNFGQQPSNNAEEAVSCKMIIFFCLLH